MALVDLGASLTETLRESATRVGATHVTAFVEHLAQALDHGAPLAEVVSAHARDAKEEYTRGLVDKAGKAEVQMLVPMVLLILPVTVIFAVYPGLQALQFGIF
jgi:tight adherence protein C